MKISLHVVVLNNNYKICLYTGKYVGKLYYRCERFSIENLERLTDIKNVKENLQKKFIKSQMILLQH